MPTAGDESDVNPAVSSGLCAAVNDELNSVNRALDYITAANLSSSRVGAFKKATLVQFAIYMYSYVISENLMLIRTHLVVLIAMVTITREHETKH